MACEPASTIKLIYFLRLLGKRMFTNTLALDEKVIDSLMYYSDKFNWKWNDIYVTKFIQQIIDDLKEQ